MRLSNTQISMIRGDIRANGVELRDLEDDILDHICTTIEMEGDDDTPFEKFYEIVKARVCPNGYKELQEETILLITQKYTNMKKFMNTSGIIGSIMLVIGSLLKVLQLPGAGIVLGVGTLTIILLYLPIMLILALQQTDTTVGKIRNISGYIGANLIVAGIFLQIMHYADNRILILGLVLFLLVFVPLFLFTSGKEAILKIQPITISVVLLAIVSSLFAFSNKNPSRAFYNSLEIVSSDIEQSYELRYETLKEIRKENDNLAASSDAVLSYIDGLKHEITETIGFNSIDEVYEAKKATSFSKKLDENLTTNSSNYEYNALTLYQYLSAFLNTLNNETPGLKTYIDISSGAEDWSKQQFYQKPIFSSYSQLASLQLEIVLLELESRSKTESSSQ